jgi:hypothetical protein
MLIKSGHLLRTFALCFFLIGLSLTSLAVVAEPDRPLSLNAPQTVFVSGWTYDGQDTGFPSEDKINASLGTYEKLRDLIESTKSLNETASQIRDSVTIPEEPLIIENTISL